MSSTWEWYVAGSQAEARQLDANMPHNEGCYLDWWNSYMLYMKTGKTEVYDKMLAEVTPTVPPDGRDAQRYGFNLPAPPPPSRADRLKHNLPVLTRIGLALAMLAPLVGIPVVLFVTTGSVGAAMISFVIMAFIEFIVYVFEYGTGKKM